MTWDWVVQRTGIKIGEGDNITFIVRSRRLHLRYLSIFLTSQESLSNDERAVHPCRAQKRMGGETPARLLSDV